MDECNLYEIVGSHNQGARNEQQRCYYDSNMYVMPNSAQFDDEDQYDELQISTLPPIASKKQSPISRQHASNSIDTSISQGTGLSANPGSNHKVTKSTKKRRGCVAVCMFVMMLMVITLAAVAIGALSFTRSLKAQITIDTLEEESMNYTSYLLDEIRALNSQLAQLHADTQGNISHLLNRLANQYQEITSVSRSLTSKLSATHSRIMYSISQLSYSVSSQARTLSTSVSQLSFSVSSQARTISTSVRQLSSSVSSQARTISTSVNQLANSAHQVSTSVRWLSTSASQLSVSASQVSTSVSHLSTSAYSLSTSVYSVSSTASWHSYYTSISLSRLSTSGYTLSSSVRQLSTSVSRLSTSFANQCTRYCITG